MRSGAKRTSSSRAWAFNKPWTGPWIPQGPNRRRPFAIRRSSEVSPIAVLARMRQEDPTAGYEFLRRKWSEFVEARPDYLTAVLDYAFRNHWSDLDDAENKAKAKAASPMPGDVGPMLPPDVAAAAETATPEPEQPRYETVERRKERVTAEVGRV